MAPERSAIESWIDVHLRLDLVSEGHTRGRFSVRANGVEFHNDELVFHQDGEVVVVHPTAAVAGITWRTISAPSDDVADEASGDKAYSVTEIRKTLPNAYAPWTDLEREQLTAEVVAGLPWKEIARSHGRGVGGVRSEAKKLGLVDD